MADETAKPVSDEIVARASRAGAKGMQAARTTVDSGAEIAREAAATGESIAAAANDQAGRFTRQAADMQSKIFGDFTKMFAELKLPAVPDMEALLAAHRRNVEVLSSANRVAMEGAQVVARRHLEIMQQTVAELTEQVRELAAPDSPQVKAAKQAELLKRSYEHAVVNMRELGDLIQKSSGEALTLLNHRFTEAVDEVRGLIEKTTPQ